ncbi:hypothetical protein NLU13_2758 [Sarocladium strictum]|uniref:PHD-type domain-containing protein n=1 Tax=Sarocladium strictum TaxID=5046 RepID=A0AA39GKR0_SARSR|nr:hypothetical protein NLU13_2758 [Sarocladium strictum]
MSGDRRSSSFGDPNATRPHPPTPQQTPDTAVFPSPVFRTPRPKQGSFSESGGWTPIFAEDYSVFNATPGNLRGSNGPFVDFVAVTPVSVSTAHKRLLSVESVAAEIASHATQFSPDPNVPLPPLDPSCRIPSTPRSALLLNESPTTQQHPLFSPKIRSSKKVRRGTLTSEPPTQTATPPPSTHKGARKLAPKTNMNDEQTYGQPDFSNMAQQHDMTAFMGSATDMFGYPMSAPVTGPASFWDPAAMGMDLDFSVTDANMFQAPTAPSHHRGIGSFDWSNDPQLFQEPSAPPALQATQNKPQSARRERALAPKPIVTGRLPEPTMVRVDNFDGMQDPFGITHMGDGVNPGLLLSRPQTSAMDLSFNGTDSSALDPTNGAGPSRSNTGRRNANTKDARGGKLPDRAIASSPIKPSFRPGLTRSLSENRGKRGISRGSLTSLTPSRSEQNLAAAPRQSGRVSPFKHQKRLSALASIPESSPNQARQRASVRFTIDSRGRARAESTMMTDSRGPSLSRSQSAREGLGRRSPGSDDDSSETDDEPIIIPSRNASFSASFALPDPLKPVGSIFSSRRSISDKSSSTTTIEGLNGGLNDEESEAETVMGEKKEGGGDAANELRKVMESRQRRSLHNGHLHPGNSQSPTPQAWPMEGRGVRCICHRNRTDESDGYMMQCESCEMWLHGRCINVTRRTIPSVYICPFCSQTPNMRGGRLRDTSRTDPLGIGSGVSPLANKSMRSFR